MQSVDFLEPYWHNGTASAPGYLTSVQLIV